MDREEHEAGEEISRRITCYYCAGNGNSWNMDGDPVPCGCAAGLDRAGLIELLRQQEMRIRALEKACTGRALDTWRA